MALLKTKSIAYWERGCRHETMSRFLLQHLTAAAILLLTHKNPLCACTLSLPVVRGVLFKAHTAHALKLAVLYLKAATHMGSRERYFANLILQDSLLPAQNLMCPNSFRKFGYLKQIINSL